jgi:hypothetical protein
MTHQVNKKMICCNCDEEKDYDESCMCLECWCKSLHQGKPCHCKLEEVQNS